MPCACRARGRGPRHSPTGDRASVNAARWRGGSGATRRDMAGGFGVTILSADHRRSSAAPPAASRNSRAHGRSPGSRRIAGAAFPDFHQVQWREKRRHAAHSRGGGHGSARGLPCSLFTLWQDRGTVRASSFQLRGGLSNIRHFPTTRRELWLRKAAIRCSADRRVASTDLRSDLQRPRRARRSGRHRKHRAHSARALILIFAS